MRKEEIYKKIYQESRIKFKTQGDFAESLGISRQNLNNILKKMEQGGNIYLETLENMCNILELEIVIQEKK